MIFDLELYKREREGETEIREEPSPLQKKTKNNNYYYPVRRSFRMIVDPTFYLRGYELQWIDRVLVDVL